MSKSLKITRVIFGQNWSFYFRTYSATKILVIFQMNSKQYLKFIFGKAILTCDIPHDLEVKSVEISQNHKNLFWLKLNFLEENIYSKMAVSLTYDTRFWTKFRKKILNAFANSVFVRFSRKSALLSIEWKFFTISYQFGFSRALILNQQN